MAKERIPARSSYVADVDDITLFVNKSRKLQPKNCSKKRSDSRSELESQTPENVEQHLVMEEDHASSMHASSMLVVANRAWSDRTNSDVQVEAV